MGVKNKKSGGQAAKGWVISLQEHPLFIYEEDLIMNHVALTGKISQDIELHTTGNGKEDSAGSYRNELPVL